MRDLARYLATFPKNREFQAIYVKCVRFLVFCVCTILWFSCEKNRPKFSPPHDRSLDPPLVNTTNSSLLFFLDSFLDILVHVGRFISDCPSSWKMHGDRLRNQLQNRRFRVQTCGISRFRSEHGYVSWPVLIIGVATPHFEVGGRVSFCPSSTFWHAKKINTLHTIK